MRRREDEIAARLRYGKAGLVAALATALAVLLLAPAAAAKAKPCGQQVIDDWWPDGRVDKIYKLRCYEDAIDRLPVDVKDYSSAEDDIKRALQAALNGKPDPGGADPTPSQGEKKPAAVAPKSEGKGPTPPAPTPRRDGPVVDKRSGSPAQALPSLGPSSADSVPIPLLVLAGLALLLLAAGSIGYVTRRLQARRLPPAA